MRLIEEPTQTARLNLSAVLSTQGSVAPNSTPVAVRPDPRRLPSRTVARCPPTVATGVGNGMAGFGCICAEADMANLAITSLGRRSSISELVDHSANVAAALRSSLNCFLRKRD